MPNSTTLSEHQSQGAGLRFRRAHAKSRNGCLRCKQQRKKCDELKPSCSRCAKRMYNCRYQSSRHDSSPVEERDSGDLPISELYISTTTPDPIASNAYGSFTLSSDRLSVPDSSPHGSSPTAPSFCSSRFPGDEEASIMMSHSPGTLDATELGLLSHYLAHTSQTIPFDDLDLYALSVGVPNIAFNSKPVMSSLIALAAACKSHDIVKQTRMPLADQTLVEVRELLTLADRHHRTSLQHIQDSVSKSDRYDDILLNAALMVLYASASHAIRVCLAAAAKRSELLLPKDLLPQHSQWILFTRSAHTVSIAVLDNISKISIHGDGLGQIIHTPPESPGTVLSPQDGPSEKTRRLFLPLVASTYKRAFESLRRKTKTTIALLGERRENSIFGELELDACLKSLPILDECAYTALTTEKSHKISTDFQPDPNCSDGSSKVSPWVGRYMSSVTSMQSPKALRRIIMSFLNKAPSGYLELIQSVLDSPFESLNLEYPPTYGSPGGETPVLNETQLLAMDIFAHWLVLVMLLDGVWWIDGIGQWELGQVVSMMKKQASCQLSANTGETWWPESMHLIKLELSPSS